MAIDRRTAAAVGLAAALVVFWPRSTPQVGPDEEAFRTLDALFTALTSRNPDRLAASEARLHTLRDEGRLAAAASQRIDAVIARARTGEWRPAAEELYEFIRAQRR